MHLFVTYSHLTNNWNILNVMSTPNKLNQQILKLVRLHGIQKMPYIDNDTLLIALQSVYESVNRYEQLLKSEMLKNRENITELLISYDEALGVLKSVYQEQIDSGANLPPLNAVIYGDKP